jgi:predicted acylesterase/phospholipase RssA
VVDTELNDAVLDDAVQRAREVIGGADITVDALRDNARILRKGGQTALVGELLTTVSRRALYDGWRTPEHADLAMRVLRDHQQFGYARRLLARVRSAGQDTELLRQQHALCTYKDLELPAARRLDQALRILGDRTSLQKSTNAETLGLAGAIHKRRWEVDAKPVALEEALWCYQRGFEQVGDPERWYAGVNAAFIADRLSALELDCLGGQARSEAYRELAEAIRRQIVDDPAASEGEWSDATLGEALFGLGRYDEARKRLAVASEKAEDLWKQETTATQLAALADLRAQRSDDHDSAGAEAALNALLKSDRAALQRATVGKVGLALSGGGFRASLYHLGTLARLAECNVLRRVEVLSCVSGGSIVGAHYYLKLRKLLKDHPDEEIPDRAYVDLVQELISEFLAGVRRNLRNTLLTTVSLRSRSERAGELFEELFYKPLRDTPSSGPWRMDDLLIKPAGEGQGFTLRYKNWTRAAKIPMLVLNATTLNTGHSWQFTASWMGESPSMLDERMDASRRLRRVYYRDAPHTGDLRGPTLGKAVAASAGVPGIFPPIRLRGLYPGVDVELVDGGVHDNQGVASLLEQDCTVLLVSDASGQLRDDEDPERWLLSVLSRSNNVLMKRVRGAQYGELLGKKRAGTLRGFMGIHLTKGLAADPRDWTGCQEPWQWDDGTEEDEKRYGIVPEVQQRLAELRTDLDSFTDDEAYALMAVGYHMTKTDLADALPTLAEAEPELELLAKWPFWPALRAIRSQAGEELAAALRYGHLRLLRKPREKLGRLRLRRR